MSYQDEIDNHLEAIRVLRNKISYEKLKNLPDIVGKFYYNNNYGYSKILNVIECDGDYECECDVMEFQFDIKNNSVYIDTFVKYRTIDMSREISKEKFEEEYNKALLMLKL